MGIAKAELTFFCWLTKSMWCQLYRSRNHHAYWNIEKTISWSLVQARSASCCAYRRNKTHLFLVFCRKSFTKLLWLLDSISKLLFIYSVTYPSVVLIAGEEHNRPIAGIEITILWLLAQSYSSNYCADCRNKTHLLLVMCPKSWAFINIIDCYSLSPVTLLSHLSTSNDFCRYRSHSFLVIGPK